MLTFRLVSCTFGGEISCMSRLKQIGIDLAKFIRHRREMRLIGLTMVEGDHASLVHSSAQEVTPIVFKRTCMFCCVLENPDHKTKLAELHNKFSITCLKESVLLVQKEYVFSR